MLFRSVGDDGGDGLPGEADLAAGQRRLVGLDVAGQRRLRPQRDRGEGGVLAGEHGVDAVEAELGPIGVLVNNAAVTSRGRFLERSADEFAAEIEVTVTGTLRISHAVARRMAEAGGGSIVSLMGDSGRVGESGLAVTATARSSTLGLTKSLAKELARHGVRANAVSIGLVQTDNFAAHTGGTDDERLKKITALYPLRRLGRPEDVTPTILLLASPCSSWTTGQVVSVNGGFSMVG